MPELVKLYIRNVAIGFGVAAVFVALLLWFNVMNLWYLVSHNADGVLAVFLLWFMHGIVFAGVQFAFAVMMMARKDDDDDDHHGGHAIRDYVAVPVRADADKAQRKTRR